MAEPRLMFSVIYGDPGEAWVNGQDPFALSDVDWWRIDAGRIDQESFFPSSPGALAPPFRREAVTEVGQSFSATLSELASVDLDAEGWFGSLLRNTKQDFPADLPAGVGALEVSLAAQLVSGVTRRRFLVSAAAVGWAGCLGRPDPTDTTPIGPTNPTGDTGTLPSLCDAGERVPWPTHTGELPNALRLVDRHAGGVIGQDVLVAVVDSGLHGIAQGAPWVESAVAVGDLDPTTDERGHGTAVIEHLRAVAPGARVRSVKYVDNSGFGNYPVAGFQRAVEVGVDRPDIVLCSWVMLDLSIALQREIANAVSRGTLVVFAAGNGTMTDQPPTDSPALVSVVYGTSSDEELVESRERTYGSRTVHAVAHPDALVVGGMTAYCNDDTGALDPSAVATDYDSAVFTGDRGLDLDRPVPDLCGLVAPLPADPLAPPVLTRTVTAAGSTLDRKPDGTPPDTGVVRTAGTSMAAAHVAGVAAMLLQAYPQLTPRAVRNVLMTTASGPTWQPATGWGLVQAEAALDWLDPQPLGMLRATTFDRGLEVPRPIAVDKDGFPHCPDLFLRPAPTPEEQARFGISFKHVHGAALTSVRGRFLYLRATNRGALPFLGFAYVHLLFGAEPTRQLGEAIGAFDLYSGVLAGDFLVVPIVDLPGEATGVVVELRLPKTPSVIVPGSVTAGDLAALVGEHRHVGATLLGGV